MTGMTMAENPWVERFEPLPSLAEIASKVRVDALALQDLERQTTTRACELIREQMEAIFVPSRQHCEIIRKLIEVTHAFCRRRYIDRKDFIFNCYDKDQKFNAFQAPLCLTGLAGIGKSHLIKALTRVLPSAQELIVDANHGPFPMQAVLRVEVNSESTEKQLIEEICKMILKSSAAFGYVKDTELSVKKGMYRNGVSLLMADELQYMTLSAGANTNVTKLLLRMSFLGVPFLYVMNFSLAHKLLKRRQEDRQRLLAHPIVLVPERHDSPDWNALVQEIWKISPDLFDVSAEAVAPLLNQLTAGLGRPLRQLVLIALADAHKKKSKVTTASLEKAYASTEYSVNREDVEAIATQVITSKKVRGRSDLWCPFSLPETTVTKAKEVIIEARETRTSQELLKSSLSLGERKALKAIEKEFSNGAEPVQTQPGKVIKMKSRAKKLTANDLIGNATQFSERPEDFS